MLILLVFMPPPVLAFVALVFLFLFRLEFFELLLALPLPPPVVAVELDVVLVVVPPALPFLLPPEHDFRNKARDAARTRAKIFGIVVLLFSWPSAPRQSETTRPSLPKVVGEKVVRI